MLSSPNLIRLTPCHLLWKAKIDLSPFDAAVIDADDWVGTVFKMLQHVLHKCGFCHFPSIPSVWMNKFLFNNKTTNILCVIDVSTAAAKTFGHDFSVLKWQGPFDFNFGWIVWITQESPTTFPIYGRQTYVTSREQKNLLPRTGLKEEPFCFSFDRLFQLEETLNFLIILELFLFAHANNVAAHFFFHFPILLFAWADHFWLMQLIYY